METTELRPLGAGELLDRAVTLYVRRFAPIVAVLAVIVVPLIVIEALLHPKAANFSSDLANLFAAGANPTAQRAALDALQADSGSGGTEIAFSFGSVLIGLLQYSAVVAVVAASYAGAQLGVGGAYRLALRLWPRQLLVGLVFAVIGIGVAIPIVILYFLLALLVFGVALATHAQLVTAILGVIVLLAWLFIVAVAFAWTYMAYQLAAVAVVTEALLPSAAIGAGLRRAFRRPTAARSLVAGLVVCALSFVGIVPILLIATLVASLGHVTALYYAVLGVGTILLNGIVYAFVVVYAADVRVRREGLDLLPSATT